MQLQWFGGPQDGATITIYPQREEDVVSIDVTGLNGEKDEDGMATGETRTFPVKNGKIIYTELTKA